MTAVQLIAILVVLLVSGAIGIWFVVKGDKNSQSKQKTGQEVDDKVSKIAQQDVEHIFDDEFREELRNRGRLHFEKIIGENAMFLQQDLRLTTSQLNDYMKDEIKSVLQEEFSKYEESIASAKDLALESIEKTKTAIDQQRLILEKQMNEQAEAEKQRILNHFEANMAGIVNHYVLSAIGSEIDLTTQLDYIFQNLEENKEDMIKDIRSGT
jgi:F0F1-type ATP synthase membrane subunit b/b'